MAQAAQTIPQTQPSNVIAFRTKAPPAPKPRAKRKGPTTAELLARDEKGAATAEKALSLAEQRRRAQERQRAALERLSQHNSALDFCRTLMAKTNDVLPDVFAVLLMSMFSGQFDALKKALETAGYRLVPMDQDSAQSKVADLRGDD